MNFQIIIHAVIIIFILHVILINLDFNVSIGKNVENFSTNNTTNNNDKSLNFLLESDDSNNDDMFKKKMNNYINNLETLSNEKKTETEFQKLNELPVKPSNSELNNENVPNFESDVTNTFNYYKINNNYDNMNENELKATSINNLDDKKKLFDEKENKIVDIDVKSNTVRESNVNPDNWAYKNEVPMNGGVMGSIVGFDGLESQYADFSDFFKLGNNDKEKFENVPHDDLRKPIIYSD
tara:strand:+ start:96 stop:809 length:714 start_codon:yes stop_codon:yes gene_type:complete